ncbi:MAG: hypothetical protein ACKVQJ_03050 [Pyrinomonadaceae bacterium]
MREKAPSVFRILIPVTDFDKAIEFYQRLFDSDGRIIHQGGGILITDRLFLP